MSGSIAPEGMGITPSLGTIGGLGNLGEAESQSSPE
jgi:hypothetical protein